MSRISTQQFGGIKFNDDGQSEVIFNYAFCDMAWQQETKIQQSCITGRITYSLPKYRMQLQVQICYNEDDIQKFVTLNSIISNIDSFRCAVTPNYAVGNTNTAYDVLLNSDIKYQKLAMQNVGQSIKLKFVSRDLYDSIPISYLDVIIVDNTSDYFTSSVSIPIKNIYFSDLTQNDTIQQVQGIGGSCTWFDNYGWFPSGLTDLTAGNTYWFYSTIQNKTIRMNW